MGLEHVTRLALTTLLALVMSVPAIAAPPIAPLVPDAAVHQIQFAPGANFDATRDCQTIRRCNFTRGGSYRGCISAYSCRRCEFVPARCTISGRERVCREARCTW
jgi:hypothetical protein